MIGEAPTPKSSAGRQATRIVEMVHNIELFHDGDVGWAKVKIQDHYEIIKTRSQLFRKWLAGQFFRRECTSPSGRAVDDAIAILDARAVFDGDEHQVRVRLAGHDNAVFLDLADASWRAVEVDANGWRIATAPPPFYRTRGMIDLPAPESGAGLSELRRFVNVADDNDFTLLLAWLLSALRPEGPYPVLVLHGEQGCCKTTVARVLRRLVDPNFADVRGEPKSPQDIMIAAKNGWIIALDNLSRIPAWLSDALCRLSTGGGFATRELYTDDQEAIFEAQRPVILTGIHEVADRADLLDRSIVLELPRVRDESRTPESAFWKEFDSARPRLLGAILYAFSGGLRALPHVGESSWPRMADFAQWAVACENAGAWPRGRFMEAYSANRNQADEVALEASAISSPLLTLMSGTNSAWSGTATHLLGELATRADERLLRSRGWPTNARGLSAELKRIAPNLRRAKAIEVQFLAEGRDRKKQRIIQMLRVGNPAPPASPPHDGAQQDGHDECLGNGGDGESFIAVPTIDGCSVLLDSSGPGGAEAERKRTWTY